MSALLELADRVEALAGPCRETDIAILKAALGYRDVHGDGRMFDRGNDGYWFVDDCNIHQLPSPTASLDAAMTLVPEGAPWSVNDPANADGRKSVFGYNSRCHARVSGSPNDRDYAATPALALCAAALRARAHNQVQQETAGANNPGGDIR